ncbi:uncharacterized protein BDFB_005645, partial [Asbolus verrucosus]
MTKFHIIFVAFLQYIFAYHHHGHQARFTSSDNFRSELQNDPHAYINFDNFDNSRRAGRQLPQFNFQNSRNPSNGFNWDSPSWDLGQSNFNRGDIRWNSEPDDRDDSFIFEDEFDNRNNFIRTTTRRVPTSTVAIPGMGTTRTPCEDRCQTTPEYNPVCGDDDMTYFSRHRLLCAQKCGK